MGGVEGGGGPSLALMGDDAFRVAPANSVCVCHYEYLLQRVQQTVTEPRERLSRWTLCASQAWEGSVVLRGVCESSWGEGEWWPHER